jgi:hypothetical protein
MLTSVNTFHAVYAFRMTKFLPRKLQYRHASGAHQNAIAAIGFFAFEWLSTQPDETEPVHQRHYGAVWTKIPAEASRYVDSENQHHYHDGKLHPKKRG